MGIKKIEIRMVMDMKRHDEVVRMGRMVKRAAGFGMTDGELLGWLSDGYVSLGR